MINTETKRRLTNPKILALKYRYFLYSNLIIFFKKSSKFSKLCLIISSFCNIIRRECKIGHSSTREHLDVYGMINFSFLIFHNCNHFIKELVKSLSSWFCTLNSIHALKTKWTMILIERNIGVKFFQTSPDNIAVDWHRQN